MELVIKLELMCMKLLDVRELLDRRTDFKKTNFFKGDYKTLRN